MIGIFDSGLGGMTVTRAIERLCPDYPVLYFGDLLRTPYGSKSPEALLDYARHNTRFLIDQGASLIVIACNSAASTAGPTLRRELSCPVLDVIKPAVSQALAKSRSGNIGVIGTRATIRSGIYQERIHAHQPDYTVHSQACPLLVPLVEEGWLKRRETKMIVKKYLRPLRERQVDTLILGCTHYPLLRPLIEPRMGKRVEVIDSSIETALALRHFLGRNPELERSLRAPGQESRFFVSDLPEPTASLANAIFGRTVHLEKVDV
ncbi:glutamate racemase [Desulfogranum mediterraneum]|uniref:glutamate racemase n=1 Tax=Desulfogranum mediterraneum TaxID=160661 RepID=UPI000410619D|nr:glutamate racemase [Desulfogranum mediterraneum]